MAIKFILLVNKQGQTRLAKYTNSSLSPEERCAFEAQIVRKCFIRSDKQVCGFALCSGWSCVVVLLSQQTLTLLSLHLNPLEVQCS